MIKKILKISIVGKTNAGKSTLLNSIIGETVSIINKKINTTEDSIIGVRNVKEHQLIFYDTPGFNFIKSINTKNKILKKNLWDGINNSDIILFVIDSRKINFKETLSSLKFLNNLNKEIYLIFNKNDLIDKRIVLPIIKKIDDQIKNITYISISAKRSLGLKKIINLLVKKTYRSDWLFNDNQITNKDDIFITNECTRNMIFNSLHKEIPYNLNVKNKQFKYLKNGHLKIKQDIEIINNRYKQIILGKNGSKIKDIRTKSQNSISKILDIKVHLYLNIVKINAKKI